jgi:hypothetical protein
MKEIPNVNRSALQKKKNYNSKRKDNKGKDQREDERNVIL